MNVPWPSTNALPWLLQLHRTLQGKINNGNISQVRKFFPLHPSLLQYAMRALQLSIECHHYIKSQSLLAYHFPGQLRNVMGREGESVQHKRMPEFLTIAYHKPEANANVVKPLFLTQVESVHVLSEGQNGNYRKEWQNIDQLTAKGTQKGRRENKSDSRVRRHRS